ncbi:MAG: hypothetical protein WC966_06940 [Bradymonadales bacterium]|jgi:hypothetical protein
MRKCWHTLALSMILLGFFGLGFVLPHEANAQENPSGALEFGVLYGHGMGGSDSLSAYARAMAVDRVPGTMVGRFGELYLSLGMGLKGEAVAYSAGLKFGLGLGTDYLVLFLATGLMVDGFSAVKESGKAKQIKPGLGLPLALGFWVDPMPGLYVYMIAEPSWAFFAKGRKTTPYLPFSFAWELRLRGGVGFDISKVHIRLDYTFHQLAPHPWHQVSIGFGLSSKYMANLGKEPL